MTDAALDLLRRADPVMRGIIRRCAGARFTPRRRRPPFESLVRAIANQQLNGRAAQTILDRFIALFPGRKFPAPDAPAALRAAALPPLGRLPGVPPRSIVFILVDDHRHDAFGFTGHPFLETPRLDALARGGVHFRNAFVTTALCSPSRASILTGVYPFRHGIVDNNTALPRGTVFFPQHLSAPGTARPSSASGTWAARATTRSRAAITGSASAARALTSPVRAA
jgi:hypothetical protein